MNSIFRLQSFDYDLIIIDECESLMKHILNLNNSRKYYNILQEIIIKSKKTFLLDYGFGDLTLQFLEDSGNLSKKNLFVLNNFQNTEKKVTYISKKTLFQKLEDKKDKKLFIGCDSKKNAEFIYNFFIVRGVELKDLFLITSDTTKDIETI